jgi:sec-independent protein translocase protein TatA
MAPPAALEGMRYQAPLRAAFGKDQDMHTPGILPMLLIAVVVLVLFGRGKVSNLMGEVGKGISAFKKGIKDGTDEAERDALQAAKDVTPQTMTEKDKA